MNKNPFSLYDFMGYLFPGCLVLILFYYCYSLDFDIYQIITIDNTKRLINTETHLSWESSLLLIVIGYATGHVIAYLSSLVLETLFTNKIFGYPSEYLLNERDRSLCHLFTSYYDSEASNSIYKIIKWIVKFIAMVLILPVALCVFTIGIFADINGFVVRPLDSFLQKTLKEKQYRLAEKLKITHPDVNEECDYHRIVMHYVYVNLPGSQRKTDNYLALYGFLRSLTFILCVLFLMLLIMSMTTIDISRSINWTLIITIVFLGVLCYLVYLGFMKFYRRFTLENLMTLLVGMPNDDCNSTEGTTLQ